MPIQAEREIFIVADRCFDLLNKSIQIFQAYLQEGHPAGDPEYYRARNFFKEGKSFFEETLKDAKKLLGPIPSYAAKEYEQWRTRTLEDNKIIALGQNLEDLKNELAADEFIKKWFKEGDIAGYLAIHYENQKSGKRKLANIKIRMLLDKLSVLLTQALELQKNAQQKQQTRP